MCIFQAKATHPLPYDSVGSQNPLGFRSEMSLKAAMCSGVGFERWLDHRVLYLSGDRSTDQSVAVSAGKRQGFLRNGRSQSLGMRFRRLCSCLPLCSPSLFQFLAATGWTSFLCCTLVPNVFALEPVNRELNPQTMNWTTSLLL